jgi:hypothetical protein
MGGGDGKNREDHGHYAYAQTETCTLTALVETVGDTGSARLRFTCDAIHIDTHFQTSGEHADWDSAKTKSCPIAGFLKYAALPGTTFEAVIGCDGKIEESKGVEWPEAKKATFKGKEREEMAASATHDPTPAMVWLEMIFLTVPSGGKDTTRSLNLQESQSYILHPEAPEATGNFGACLKTKIESADRKRLVNGNTLKLGKLPTAELVASEMAKANIKKGASWFSAKLGFLAKAEIKSSIEGYYGKDQIVTAYEWTVNLKDRGFGKVPSGGPGQSPSDRPGPEAPTK